jgi:anti-sigma-K factor RskA
VSARDPHGEPGDCGRDAGAYVLGCLEGSELEEFERHLGGCVVCRDEIAALRSVVELLPMAAPQLEVPRALRRRVLAQVRAEAREQAPGGARRPWLGARMPRARGPLAFAALAAAAIAAAVVALVGGSSHARSVSARVVYPSASAVVRLQSGHAELVVRHMPAAPPGHIYEVWLKRGPRPPAPTSALFGVTSAGAATVDVPGDLRGVSEVLVTPERLGGSLRPTRAPVIIAHLA